MEAGDRRAPDSPPLPRPAWISGTAGDSKGSGKRAHRSAATRCQIGVASDMDRDPPDKTANRTAHTYVANLAFSQAAHERDNHRSMP